MKACCHPVGPEPSGSVRVPLRVPIRALHGFLEGFRVVGLRCVRFRFRVAFGVMRVQDLG